MSTQGHPMRLTQSALDEIRGRISSLQAAQIAFDRTPPGSGREDAFMAARLAYAEVNKYAPTDIPNLLDTIEFLEKVAAQAVKAGDMSVDEGGNILCWNNSNEDQETMPELTTYLEGEKTT